MSSLNSAEVKVDIDGVDSRKQKPCFTVLGGKPCQLGDGCPYSHDASIIAPIIAQRQEKKNRKDQRFGPPHRRGQTRP